MNELEDIVNASINFMGGGMAVIIAITFMIIRNYSSNVTFFIGLGIITGGTISFVISIYQLRKIKRKGKRK